MPLEGVWLPCNVEPRRPRLHFLSRLLLLLRYVRDQVVSVLDKLPRYRIKFVRSRVEAELLLTKKWHKNTLMPNLRERNMIICASSSFVVALAANDNFLPNIRIAAVKITALFLIGYFLVFLCLLKMLQKQVIETILFYFLPQMKGNLSL